MPEQTRHPLTPAPPEKETQITFYSFGGAHISSTGPRGGWSGMSLSHTAVGELLALIDEHYVADGPEMRCPRCGDEAHLYSLGSPRWDPKLRRWRGGEPDGEIECTECDWSGMYGEATIQRWIDEAGDLTQANIDALLAHKGDGK